MPLNLARLLVRKGRTNLAGDIAAAFRQLVDDESGIAHVYARTAVPIDEAELAALTTRLRDRTGKNVVLETEVDPSLLGGIVIQIGDQLVDASTRARLQALRGSLVGAV
jgi:F-type H+-transporting ATPase subunit delta